MTTYDFENALCYSPKEATSKFVLVWNIKSTGTFAIWQLDGSPK